jgi:hypothetical protein
VEEKFSIFIFTTPLATGTVSQKCVVNSWQTFFPASLAENLAAEEKNRPPSNFSFLKAFFVLFLETKLFLSVSVGKV